MQITKAKFVLMMSVGAVVVLVRAILTLLRARS